MTVDLAVVGWSVAAPPVRFRARGSAPRTQRLFLRLSAEELDVVAAAASRVGLTPTGYAGEAAVASARAAGGSSEVDVGVSRAELAQVQRELFAARTAVVAAAAALCGVTSPEAEGGVAGCAAAVARLDDLVAEVHGLLLRSVA